jgi:hypothetical protein
LSSRSHAHLARNLLRCWRAPLVRLISLLTTTPARVSATEPWCCLGISSSRIRLPKSKPKFVEYYLLGLPSSLRFPPSQPSPLISDAVEGSPHMGEAYKLGDVRSSSYPTSPEVSWPGRVRYSRLGARRNHRHVVICAAPWSRAWASSDRLRREESGEVLGRRRRSPPTMANHPRRFDLGLRRGHAATVLKSGVGAIEGEDHRRPRNPLSVLVNPLPAVARVPCDIQ